MIIFFIKVTYVASWMFLISAIVADIAAIHRNDLDDMYITTKKKLLLNIVLPFYFLWPIIGRVLTDWHKKLK